MVSVIHGEGDRRRSITVPGAAWITDAVRFGYWLTEQTLRRKGADRLFAFISSPTLSCLPGFILLGCVLRNKLSVSNEAGEEHRRILHFLRLWEAGEGSELRGPDGKKYRVVHLRWEQDRDTRLRPGHFRRHPDRIHAITQYTVAATKWSAKGGAQWLVSTRNCLDYSLGKSQTAYERVLENLRDAAGLPGTNETCRRIPVFLAGPSRKNITALYARDIRIRCDGVGVTPTLNELMNLDTTGRNINPHYWNDGSWLNPKARRKREAGLAVAAKGVAIMDGGAAWERWSEALQISTRALVFHRTSSNLRYERMRTILNQVHCNLGSSLVCEGHPWFKEFNTIRAFVHEWQ
jgi:hypothetical protein